MRRVLGMVLLLLQFGPLLGAGLCLHAARSRVECEMPMAGMPQETHASHFTPTQECAQLALCAPVAPMMPVTVPTLSVTAPDPAIYPAPVLLPLGDPIAPPQLPPIA